MDMDKDMMLIILTAIVGILWCFLGLKLVRIWSAIFGFGIGGGAGLVIAKQFTSDPWVILIVGVVLGIVFACLGSIWYRGSMFFVAFLAGAGLTSAFLVPTSLVRIGICCGIGFVLALLTLLHAEVVTMILTAVYGAVLVGDTMVALLPIEDVWVQILICVVVAILGICSQFVMESGKRKKLNLKKAKEIREQTSVENEVEKARAMIDELDKTDIS